MKLTEKDKGLILQLVQERRNLAKRMLSLSNKELARKFEVHPMTITKTVKLLERYL